MSANNPPAAPRGRTGPAGTLLTAVRRSAFLGSNAGRVAAVMITLAVLVLVLAPLLAPYDLDAQSANAFAGPSSGHWLGTDEFGRDLLSRLLYAIRLDMVLALVAIPAGAAVGTLLGLSGIVAPWLGQLSSRMFDVVIGFPTLILGIAIAMVMTPGPVAVGVTIAVVNIPIFGRLARGGMLTQLDRDYVLAARSLGASRWRLLWRHVLPNIAPALLVQSAVSIADAVFIEGGLSILGLGIQPPSASLGSLLQTGLPYISASPLYVLAPTVALAWIILGFTVAADVRSRRADR